MSNNNNNNVEKNLRPNKASTLKELLTHFYITLRKINVSHVSADSMSPTNVILGEQKKKNEKTETTNK